ncbi:MAG: hypothetical protein NTV34_17770, partial [Proteobacteria bacterium]|nr:hypothetical protein [Pseudomonadota bacterium]
MTTSLLLFFLLSASFSAAGFALWRAKDNAGYKRRLKQVQGSRLPQARANDRVRHSRQDLQAIAKAKEMAKNGQVRPAALLLEQSGLQRECIELLEKSGLIDEAASVLIKMQRQNRAGYVYARNGRWLQASECFKSANLPLEAAKCLRACERYEEAANLYKAAGKLEDAATCFSLQRRWHDAAKIYLQLKQHDKAKRAYELFFSSESGQSDVSFEAQEIGFFQNAISSGDMNTGFIDVLAQSGKVTDLIRALLSAGKLEEASRVYAKSVMDHGPALIGEVSLQGSEGRELAELFLLVKNFK